jgi:hypothetical protein
MTIYRSAVFVFLFVCLAVTALADTDSSNETGGFSYGSKGLQFESADGNNFLWFGVRLQTRYSDSAIDHDDAPGQPTESGTETKLNRGRLKLGGHVLTPRFAVYTEYDFSKDQLLGRSAVRGSLHCDTVVHN